MNLLRSLSACERKQIERTGKVEKRVHVKGNIHEPSSFLKCLREKANRPNMEGRTRESKGICMKTTTTTKIISVFITGK